MYLAMLNPSASTLLFPSNGVGNFNNQNINPLLGFSGIPQMGGVNGLGHSGQGHTGHHGGGGSAASFHQPAEKNQIKLFVGGLAF